MSRKQGGTIGMRFICPPAQRPSCWASPLSAPGELPASCFRGQAPATQTPCTPSFLSLPTLGCWDLPAPRKGLGGESPGVPWGGDIM